MDRLFDNSIGTKPKLSNGHWLPGFDMSEFDDEMVIKMDIPGRDQKDIKDSMSGGYLNIAGKRQEKEEKKKQFHSLEHKLGLFETTIAIPTVVDSEKIKAEYGKGVLEIHLTRTAEAKPYRIPVTSR